MSWRPGAIRDIAAASGRNRNGRVKARCTIRGAGRRIGRRSSSSGRNGASSGTGVAAI